MSAIGKHATELGAEPVREWLRLLPAVEAMLEEATAVAIKRVIAWQIAHEMEARR